jgi:IS605 OrfB family transposase
MVIRKAYKFRLKTNSDIEQTLWRFSGHSRFVWNYFWRVNKHRLDNRMPIMRYNEMDFWSKILKKSEEFGFLSEAPAHVLQQKLKDLDKAYSDGFDKRQPLKRMPKKHKRNLHNSFRFPQAQQFEIDNRRVKLPKIGWVGFYKSCEIEGTPKNLTVSYKSGHWYMSVQVEVAVEKNLPSNDIAVGIDVGIAKFATLSTMNSDQIIEPINIYRGSQDALAKEQRKLSKKVKFSRNWVKQKNKIQKLHSKIASTRKDYLHKITSMICKNHATICIEDLKVSNMSRSAKGTAEKHGKNVKAKSGLNKSILDQGWHEFRRQLEYKTNWNGGKLIAVNPKYTSQKCACCGHVERANRQSQADFECMDCGYSANADINAARNILAAGLAVLACGVDALVSTVKQEPVGKRELVPTY